MKDFNSDAGVEEWMAENGGVRFAKCRSGPSCASCAALNVGITRARRPRVQRLPKRSQWARLTRQNDRKMS
jgi:hypothetical protein